jgi:hypothetical protein
MATKQCFNQIVVPEKLEKCCLIAAKGIFVTEVTLCRFQSELWELRLLDAALVLDIQSLVAAGMSAKLVVCYVI